MITRLTILASVLYVASSLGGMDPIEFTRFIEPMCFKNDEKTGILLVNGQENPLASTLENFISMAEKFEMANPTLQLRDELFFFIRNFTYENIQFSPKGPITKWKPAETDYTEVENLWEPNEFIRKKIPEVEDPFTEAEKCSIFFMLSHSVLATPKTVTKQRSYINASIDEVYRSDVTVDDLYPQEQGVVAIMGTDAAVSLSRVLTGMYVGLQDRDKRKRPLDSFPRIAQGKGEFPQDTEVDTLYTLTLAEVLMIAKWIYEDRDELAPNGEWKSIPIGSDRDIKDVCPMIYKLQKADSAYTYSSVRGAADGLILGKVVGPLERKNSNIRLSQILRMYYSKSGLSEKLDDVDMPVWASFCNREHIIASLEETLKHQMLLFGFLVTTTFTNLEESRDRAWSYYQSEKSGIYGLWNTVLKDYCETTLTIDKPEYLNKETPLDVIVVLDSSDGQVNFERQQMIVGYMAKEMDLRYYGSRMTILTDQRVSSSTPGLVELKPVVEDTFSTACAACVVTQISMDTSEPAPRDQVIQAINQLLQSKKENETKYSGVRGKVVVYFSFEDEQKPIRRNPNQVRVEKALRDLHVNHQDVLFFALGKNPQVLKKYARYDAAFVMSAVDGSEEENGKNLFKKIINSPALLQYTDCKEARSENSALYEYFVTPNAVQHWSMPANYFYKSIHLKISFESTYGPIRICHSRATTTPELEATSCLDTVSTNRIEFKHSNPCKSFTKETCSPFYFSVLGINSTDDKYKDFCQDTNDVKCRTLDQIKFKVSHEGIRCSGCLGLIATPVSIMLSAILSHILIKMF